MGKGEVAMMHDDAAQDCSFLGMVGWRSRNVDCVLRPANLLLTHVLRLKVGSWCVLATCEYHTASF